MAFTYNLLINKQFIKNHLISCWKLRCIAPWQCGLILWNYKLSQAEQDHALTLTPHCDCKDGWHDKDSKQGGGVK